jgi:hypothetical protein
MSRQGGQIQIVNAQMFKTLEAVSGAIENVRIPYRFLILNFCLPSEMPAVYKSMTVSGPSIFHWGHSILFRI